MSESFEPDVSAANPVSEHWIWAGGHRPPVPRALVESMTSEWAPLDPSDEVHPASAYCERRRRRLYERLGERALVIATGNLKVRANDTDYRFRPASVFYLTGCAEPDAVLVIAPDASGCRSTLYVPERRDNRSHEFYTDSRYGELWVGPRRGTREAADYYRIDTAPIEHLAKDLTSLSSPLCVRGFDAALESLLAPQPDDQLLAEELAERGAEQREV